MGFSAIQTRETGSSVGSCEAYREVQNKKFPDDGSFQVTLRYRSLCGKIKN